MTRRDRIIGLPAVALRWPRVAIGAWVVLAATAGIIAAMTLRVDTGTTSFLDRSGPEWAIYQGALRRFGGDEYIAVSLEGRVPYDWDLLGKLREISSELAAIKGVRRVDSLASLALIRAGADGEILTDGAVEDGIPAEDEARRELRDAIEEDLVANRFVISADGRHIGLAIVLDRNLDADRAAIVEQVRGVLRGYPASISGVPVFRTEVNLRTQLETLLFVPLTLLLIAILAYLWLRNIRGVVALLASGGAGSLITVALMGLAGVPLSLSTMILPSILLALGCAYTMHLLVAAQGVSKGEELLEAAQSVSRGVAWSGATTAIGFAAMATTEVEAIRELAAYGAVGVLMVTGASLSLAPAILGVGHANIPETSLIRRTRELSVPLARMVVLGRGWIVGAWCVATVAVGVGALNVRVETNIIEWFEGNDPIRADYDEVRRNFSGITPVSVILESRNGTPVTDPSVLEVMEKLRADLEGLDSVGRVLAVTQPLEMTRRAFGAHGLPQSVQEAEQYLLMLEGEPQLGDVIAPDRTAAQLLLRLDSNLSDDIVGVAGWVDEWWDRNGLPDYSVETTGLMYEFARAQEAIARSQLRGLGLAIVAIGGVLVVSLGSIPRALIAMVPNALPIAIGFGVMGLLGVPLDAATVCLGNLALGIAVDDTVHVMLSAERVSSRDAVGMVEGALRPILPALSLTTICIAGGFLVLGLSDFVLVRNLGLVTAGVVSLCWAADVTLLPALLAKRIKV